VAPRRLLVCCDLGCAVLVAVMTLPGTPLPVLFALLCAMSLLMPVAGGTRGALVADVLPPEAVVPARSLLRLVSQGAQICGYAAGGGLLAVLSPRNVPLRRVLLLGWLVPFLMSFPEALAAPSVAARGLPASATGWWLAAGPVGTVAGELAGIWLIPAARRGRLAAPLAACGFVPFLVFALRPPLVPALVLLGTAGLCGAYMLGLDQLVLDVTPPELLGRAYTVNSSGLMTTQGLGFAAAGALGEVVPADAAITIAGAAGLLVVALCRPRRRA
jgi:hypothetical protein